TADAALLPLFIHSYRRLGVLAPLTAEGYRARPLDERRAGFVLGEIGAAILLKRLPPDQPPRPGQIMLLDTAVAAGNHDLIRTDPKMPALRHLAASVFAGRKVDVLHPHAPGTTDHDPGELAALSSALHEAGQQTVPDVYACKGALGHNLGAA